MLPEPAVLITDPAGVVVDMTGIADAGDDIDFFDGILSPGFINCHCHLELSHLKGRIPRHTGLVDFVKAVMNQREQHRESIEEAILKGEDEMLQAGIVAVGDTCNTADTIFQKLAGRLWYQNFIEVSGFVPAAAEIRFNKMMELYNGFVNQLPHNSLVPHAPYSVSKQLLKMIVGLPGNDLLTMHNQETAAENELYQNKQGGFLELYRDMGIDIEFFKPTGTSSLCEFLPAFKNYRPLILVHNLFTSENDLVAAQLIFDSSPSQLYFCLCPNANLYIGNRLPDVELFRKHQCNLVLGTDSLASNDQLNIMEEIHTLQANFPSLALSEMLQWATSNGAHALGIEETYGSFGKGKKPGILHLKEKSVQRIL